MTNDELTRQFAFEESIAERLGCVPMAVRYKLDAAGIKLHLKQWARLPTEERRTLLSWPFASQDDLTRFADRIRSLVESGKDPALEIFTPAGWRSLGQLPDAVRRKTSELGHALSQPQWEKLTPLQRFALVKLSAPKHDAEKLRPALEEFGVAPK